MSNDNTPSNFTNFSLHKATVSEEVLIGLKESLAALRESKATVMEYHQILAELKFSQYSSFRKAGFSEEQSLSLCQGSDII